MTVSRPYKLVAWTNRAECVDEEEYGLLVNRVKREEVVKRGMALAQRVVATCPRRAIAATKHILLRGESIGHSTADASDLDIQCYMLNRLEHKQLFRVFVDQKK